MTCHHDIPAIVKVRVMWDPQARLQRFPLFVPLVVCAAFFIGCSNEARESEIANVHSDGATVAGSRNVLAEDQNLSSSDPLTQDGDAESPGTSSQRGVQGPRDPSALSDSSGEDASGGSPGSTDGRGPIPVLGPPAPSGTPTLGGDRPVSSGGAQGGDPLASPPPVPTVPPIQGVTGGIVPPPTVPPAPPTTTTDTAPSDGFVCEVTVFRYDSSTYSAYRINVRGTPRNKVWVELDLAATRSTYEVALAVGTGSLEVISQARATPTAFVYSSADLSRSSLGCVS